MTVSIAVGGNFGVRTNQDDLPANGMLMTGGLTITQPLTLGHQLVYRSDTVNPRPVVVVETSLLSTSSVPDSIDAQLTFGGVVGSTVSYTTSGLSAGEALRFALQVDGSSLATGWYSYTLTLTAWFGGNSYSRAYTGSQAAGQPHDPASSARAGGSMASISSSSAAQTLCWSRVMATPSTSRATAAAAT